MLADITYTGQTLYQEALLQFMAALSHEINMVYFDKGVCEKIANAAQELAEAYINQLNKQP